MSESQREAFERHNPKPKDAVFSERINCYRRRDYPTVSHPYDDDWEMWQEACEWQADQQEPALYQIRCKPAWEGDYSWTKWEDCSKDRYDECRRVPLLHDWQWDTRVLYVAMENNHD